MNLNVTADESCLDPHISCVQTSHPAAPLDVNAEQRSVRQPMMSGPHRADSAHTLTTFGTSGKFIRASSYVPSECGGGSRRQANHAGVALPFRTAAKERAEAWEAGPISE
jgi:hypothetical protein